MMASVGLVSQWYDPEQGSAAQAAIIARSITRQGHAVTVVTGHPNYPSGTLYDGYSLKPYQHEIRDGLSVHRSFLYPSHDSRASRRMLNYASFAASASAVALAKLGSVDVSLVHATPATAALPAMALKLLRRKPYVVHVHDLWPDSVINSGFLGDRQQQMVQRVLHRYCDQMYRHASAIAVTSPGMIDRIADRGVPRSKLHFVPNWADETLFTPSPASSAVADGSATRDSDEIVVMYAGNLGPYQDLETVVRAADLLRSNRQVRFVLVGDGVLRRDLERMTESLGLDNVTFAGPRPYQEMPAVMRQGDLHLVTLKDLPLFTTTLPSKLVSTFASGKPILGSLSGDAAALVNRSGAGEVVPPESPAKMAAAIVRFSRLTAEQRQERGAASYRFYQSELNEQTVAARLSGLLEQAARRRRS